MQIQLVAHTTGGEIVGKWTDTTEEEVEAFRQSIKDVLSEGLKYLDLDTEAGWVIVPGDQLLYMAANVS